MVLGQIAAGFIANQGMYTFYISLAYIFTFLPLYLLIDGALRWPKEKRLFKRDEVELSFYRLKKAVKFMLALTGASIVGEIVFMVFFLRGFDLKEIYFLVVELIVGAADFLLLRLNKGIKVNEIAKGDDGSQANSVDSAD